MNINVNFERANGEQYNFYIPVDEDYLESQREEAVAHITGFLHNLLRKIAVSQQQTIMVQEEGPSGP